MITKAYYDSDGKFVRATLTSKGRLFRSTTWGYQIAAFGALLGSLGPLILTRRRHRHWVSPAVLVFVACLGGVVALIGLLVHVRTRRYGLALTIEGFRSTLDDRVHPWSSVRRFFPSPAAPPPPAARPDRKTMPPPSILVEFTDGCVLTVMELQPYSLDEIGSWADVLNRFHSADAAGRADLVRPFTPITLKPGE